MTIRFSADEIFEMANQIELNGAKFYRQAARSSDDASTRQMLLELAEMEDQHRRTFQELRQQLQATGQEEFAEPEPALYLRAFADEVVFDPRSPAGQELDQAAAGPLAEILRIAIGLEKDSIAFYTGLRELVPPHLGQDKVQQIIREEMQHVVTLSQKFHQLKD